MLLQFDALLHERERIDVEKVDFGIWRHRRAGEGAAMYYSAGLQIRLAFTHIRIRPSSRKNRIRIQPSNNKPDPTLEKQTRNDPRTSNRIRPSKNKPADLTLEKQPGSGS